VKKFGLIESKGFEGPGPAVSPALPIMSSQELIEQILLDAVHASGLVEVRFGVEATRLLAGSVPADGEATIEVRVRRTGAVERITGAALVAADGSASLVRGELGLEMEGQRGLLHIVNCYFRADIERLIRDRRGVLFFVSNETARGVLQPLDGAGRWLCQISVAADDWSLDVFTKQRARDWIRAAVGVVDLEPDIISLGLWQLNATVVDRFVQGRIMLCGDAAHQFPPTGGLGVNTGLQGMHNAMWKLALCVRDEAGWPLLHTYHTERRAVAQVIAEQSLQNSINVGRIGSAAIFGGESGLTTEEVVTASRRYGNHLGVEFGAAYESPAVVPDGTRPPAVADPYSDYVQSATPGCRAPHVWLGRRDTDFSTLDLIGPAFTLFTSPDGTEWRRTAERTARELDIPIDSYTIGGTGLADRGDFRSAYGLQRDGAVLVRPDGHVGWRSAGAPVGDIALHDALRSILAR
jgi:2-polyprenyl-6-methoxyphenol hydroxylase-like FAD-dependent oxidoreductase